MSRQLVPPVVTEGEALTELRLEVRSFLETHAIAVVDLAPRFAEQTDPTSLWVARDDSHPNARAHALIAQYTFDTLRELVR